MEELVELRAFLEIQSEDENRAYARARAKAARDAER